MLLSQIAIDEIIINHIFPIVEVDEPNEIWGKALLTLVHEYSQTDHKTVRKFLKRWQFLRRDLPWDLVIKQNSFAFFGLQVLPTARGMFCSWDPPWFCLKYCNVWGSVEPSSMFFQCQLILIFQTTKPSFQLNSSEAPVWKQPWSSQYLPRNDSYTNSHAFYWWVYSAPTGLAWAQDPFQAPAWGPKDSCTTML